jgi:large-conductance mechanosensitive channel
MNLLSLILKAAGEPVPSESAEPTAISTSPGTIGFVFTFFIAAAAVFLIYDMVRRIRRMRYRAEIQEEISEEQAAAEEAAELAKQNKKN